MKAWQIALVGAALFFVYTRSKNNAATTAAAQPVDPLKTVVPQANESKYVDYLIPPGM